jgi:hypothetical protein
MGVSGGTLAIGDSTCANVPANTDAIRIGNPSNQVCTRTGGEPTGGVVLRDPVTLCCQR